MALGNTITEGRCGLMIDIIMPYSTPSTTSYNWIWTPSNSIRPIGIWFPLFTRAARPAEIHSFAIPLYCCREHMPTHKAAGKQQGLYGKNDVRCTVVVSTCQHTKLRTNIQGSTVRVMSNTAIQNGHNAPWSEREHLALVVIQKLQLHGSILLSRDFEDLRE